MIHAASNILVCFVWQIILSSQRVSCPRAVLLAFYDKVKHKDMEWSGITTAGSALCVLPDERVLLCLCEGVQ